MSRTAAILPFFFIILFGAGCGTDHFQSALHPDSAAASKIARLWWVMLIVYGLVFLITMGLCGYAFARPAAPRGTPEPQPPGGFLAFVVGGGIIFPLIVFIAMLFYALVVSVQIRTPETAFTVQVTGHKWWWDVRYPEHDITIANEIYIPAGEPIRLELQSADVVHSFWVPNLHGKMDALPDYPTSFWLQADNPGVYRGQCAEFCGKQHALMGFKVIVVPPDEFEQWVEARQSPPPEPEEGKVVDGHNVFFETGCHACHAIRGTDAVSEAGPDLTALANRRTLGAATLPNTRENLADWILEPERIKPGNLMPPTELTEDQLEALLAYLETLK